jgi:hypothetical protein
MQFDLYEELPVQKQEELLSLTGTGRNKVTV